MLVPVFTGTSAILGAKGGIMRRRHAALPGLLLPAADALSGIRFAGAGLLAIP